MNYECKQFCSTAPEFLPILPMTVFGYFVVPESGKWRRWQHTDPMSDLGGGQ
jgi:hypothetical protein